MEEDVESMDNIIRDIKETVESVRNKVARWQEDYDTLTEDKESLEEALNAMNTSLDRRS